MTMSMPVPRRPPNVSWLRLVFALVLATVACSDASEDTVSAERVAAYRTRIPELAAEDCRRHDTNASAYGPACEAASSAFHEAVGDLLATVPPTWEKQVLAIGGICRGKAYRYAQSELDRREETDLLVEGLAAAPACLEEQFELLKDVARREGVPVPGD